MATLPDKPRKQLTAEQCRTEAIIGQRVILFGQTGSSKKSNGRIGTVVGPLADDTGRVEVVLDPAFPLGDPRSIAPEQHKKAFDASLAMMRRPVGSRPEAWQVLPTNLASVPITYSNLRLDNAGEDFGLALPVSFHRATLEMKNGRTFEISGLFDNDKKPSLDALFKHLPDDESRHLAACTSPRSPISCFRGWSEVSQLTELPLRVCDWCGKATFPALECPKCKVAGLPIVYCGSKCFDLACEAGHTLLHTHDRLVDAPNLSTFRGLWTGRADLLDNHRTQFATTNWRMCMLQAALDRGFTLLTRIARGQMRSIAISEAKPGLNDPGKDASGAPRFSGSELKIILSDPVYRVVCRPLREELAARYGADPDTMEDAAFYFNAPQFAAVRLKLMRSKLDEMNGQPKLLWRGLLYLVGEASLFWSMVLHWHQSGTSLPIPARGVDFSAEFSTDMGRGSVSKEEWTWLAIHYDRAFVAAAADIYDVQCMYHRTQIGCSVIGCRFRHPDTPAPRVIVPGLEVVCGADVEPCSGRSELWSIMLRLKRSSDRTRNSALSSILGEEDAGLGMRVRLHSLVKTPELNDCEGEIVALPSSGERYAVLLDPPIAKKAALRLKNLTAATPEGGAGREDHYWINPKPAADERGENAMKDAVIDRIENDQVANHTHSTPTYQKGGSTFLKCVNQCGHCGSTEGPFQKCGRCKNTMYCSRKCQKSDWPRHRQSCAKLKKERKSVKKHRPNNKKDGRMVFSAGTGVGSVTVVRNYEAGTHVLACETTIGQVMPKLYGEVERLPHEPERSPSRPNMKRYIFTEKNDWNEIAQSLKFLVACGPLNDIRRAKAALDELTKGGMTPHHIQGLRLPGALFTPLDWASRKGNTEIVEWLLTDPRTTALVKVGTPVGWACYTNRVKIARMLVAHGADHRRTDDVLFYGSTPLKVAAENQALLAMKFLANECGHDVTGRDGDFDYGGSRGRKVLGLLEAIEGNDSKWAGKAGSRACVKWLFQRGCRWRHAC